MNRSKSRIISHSNLKHKHLYRVFRQLINELDPCHDHTSVWHDDNYDLPGMIADLNRLAPPGHYFGLHRDLGSDFGFYPNKIKGGN